MKTKRAPGSTDVTIIVFIRDASETSKRVGKTGLVAANLNCFYSRVETDNDVTVAEVTLSNATGTADAHTDGLLEEISPNMPGFYRLDLPDAVFAAGATEAQVTLTDAGANNIDQVTVEFLLEVTAPTAAAIRTEIDSNSTQLAAIVADTNELQTDWANGGRLDLIVDAILVDTNDLQTNQGNWLTATGFSTHSAADVRTEMDANSTRLTAIVADTNELQTDWANGGRLDLLIDAILVDTGTTLPGTLTTVLSNQTTIAGYIDTEVGAIKAVTDNLPDSGALTTISGKLDDIQGATFDTATDSLEAIRNRGDAAWTTGAGGSAPTVEEIRAEIDANSTQLAAIVEDTGTSLPATLTTVLTSLTTITTDTNELQTDWADGGRLDLILDTAAEKTGMKLASDGLDSVTIETGVNARQALSIISAAVAGVLSGAGGSSITVRAIENAGTTRIVATVDGDGNRSSLVLTLPS